jgi:ADP-L-glycero-D-manno-heptose 6-epimerase
VKYFNVFGPNEDHKGDMRSVVSKANLQIRESGEIRLFKSYDPKYPDGGQMRDFLYVKDAVEMTLHFAEKGSAAGGLFNLGSGRGQHMADAGGRHLRRPRQGAEDRVHRDAGRLRAKYQYYTKADISKLRASGYDRPVTPLTAAVADYVRNYLVPGKRLGD